MQRPEVRIVQGQEEQINNNPQIDSWEAEQLMRKYGYENASYSTNEPMSESKPMNELTFEEMIRQAEEQEIYDRLRSEQQMNGPKPISFDGRNGYHTQTTYETDSDTGFGFKIQITSDMNIPKNY
jgi:hypothetical protein